MQWERGKKTSVKSPNKAKSLHQFYFINKWFGNVPLDLHKSLINCEFLSYKCQCGWTLRESINVNKAQLEHFPVICGEKQFRTTISVLLRHLFNANDAMIWNERDSLSGKWIIWFRSQCLWCNLCCFGYDLYFKMIVSLTQCFADGKNVIITSGCLYLNVWNSYFVRISNHWKFEKLLHFICKTSITMLIVELIFVAKSSFI